MHAGGLNARQRPPRLSPEAGAARPANLLAPDVRTQERGLLGLLLALIEVLNGCWCLRRELWIRPAPAHAGLTRRRRSGAAAQAPKAAPMLKVGSTPRNRTWFCLHLLSTDQNDMK